MEGKELATERTQSPEPLDRIPENSVATTQTDELATPRGRRKNIKSPSVSSALNNSIQFNLELRIELNYI